MVPSIFDELSKVSFWTQNGVQIRVVATLSIYGSASGDEASYKHGNYNFVCFLVDVLFSKF